MAQAVSRRPLTAEAWASSRLSPCGICGGQIGTGTGFSPGSLVLPCQYHSTVVPYLRIIIWAIGDRSSETYSHPIDMNMNIVASTLRMWVRNPVVTLIMSLFLYSIVITIAILMV
jgi:hypothetical protein